MSPTTQAALSSVQNYQQLDPTQAISTANTNYDVGGNQTRLSALQGVVGNLQSSLDSVDPSVTGRTSGNFTTEGQRTALVGKEQTPIAANLGKAQTAATASANTLTQSQSLASSMATALLNGDKDKYQQLLDTYNASDAQDKETEAKAEADRTFQEQQRQFNVTAAQNAAKSTTSAATSTAGYTAKSDSTGGGSHFYYKGAPITAAQFYDATGNANDLSNFLKNDPNSKNAYSDFSSGKYTYDQLAAKYPYIFGGV